MNQETQPQVSIEDAQSDIKEYMKRLEYPEQLVNIEDRPKILNGYYSHNVKSVARLHSRGEQEVKNLVKLQLHGQEFMQTGDIKYLCLGKIGNNRGLQCNICNIDKRRKYSTI